MGGEDSGGLQGPQNKKLHWNTTVSKMILIRTSWDIATAHLHQLCISKLVLILVSLSPSTPTLKHMRRKKFLS